MPIGDILQGTASVIGSYAGHGKRKAARDRAQSAYDQSLDAYFSQDISNPFANMENTMEDLTVNTQAADFAAAQQAQGLSDVLGQTRQAAGGSGIAALAQSLANQQSQNAVSASASIAQQEASNQRAAASMAAQNQMAERQGDANVQAQRSALLGERMQIDAAQLATREKAVQDAMAARAQGFGQIAGGVGDAAMIYAAGGGFGTTIKDGVEALNKYT
jgi:hypothetical protein